VLRYVSSGVPTSKVGTPLPLARRKINMDESIEQIETRRLLALQAQAATFGPHTDPSVLIEIQDLTRRNRGSRFDERRQLVNNLDYDFLMNVVAAALVRLGAVETALHRRAFIRDLWMLTITVIVFVSLILQLYAR
jgi:hypothetical protein